MKSTSRVGRTGPGCMPNIAAMRGHMKFQRKASPLPMLKAWLAARASVDAHSMARLSSPTSVVKVSAS
ncbi:hypothetical protein D3C83_214350 [compost metagenome]